MLTVATAIVAVTGAFVGSSNAKSLLQDERWVLIEDPGNTHSTATAAAACPGDDALCAFQVDANGNPTGDQFFSLAE